MIEDPVAPARFAHPLDVAARYRREGVIASELLDADGPEGPGWVQLRIIDVESTLIGLVPSLGAPIGDIGEARLLRVNGLVCDKVLELYRNPNNSRSKTSEMGVLTETDTFRGDWSDGPIAFTAQELASVQKKRTGRRNLGMARLGTMPWTPC